MKLLKEKLNHLPISTSQKDLSDRILLVFDLLEGNSEGTNAEYAQAFVDAVSYQSYAGNIPINDEKNILNWISKTYNEENESYIDAVAH